MFSENVVNRGKLILKGSLVLVLIIREWKKVQQGVRRFLMNLFANYISDVPVSTKFLNEYFETVDCELTTINRESAKLAWESRWITICQQIFDFFLIRSNENQFCTILIIIWVTNVI